MSKGRVINAYLDAVKLLHQNDSVLVRDTNLKTLYISNSRAKLMGVSDPNKIIGNICSDLPSVENNEANTIVNTINKMIASNKKIAFIVSYPNNINNISMYNLACKQIINPSNDQNLGYISFIEPLSIEQHVRFVYEALDIIEDKIRSNNPTIQLTKREHEVLILACLKLSSREIADTINRHSIKQISLHTVGNIIRQQLFKKFCVYSIQSLIEKAMQTGYLQAIANICNKYKLIQIQAN